MPTFSIDGTELDAALDGREGDRLRIRSVPRPYDVSWMTGDLASDVDGLVAEASHPLVLIDAHVEGTILAGCGFAERGVPVTRLRAGEDTKTVAEALEVCGFLQRREATRGSMLFVIGGGVLQDVGAFAAAAYKRGIPWTYLPTTLLGQGDSCIGGKTGLNHDGIKNLIALFSAPSRVVIHAGFLPTLADADIRSGLGEIFRLHVTGGERFLSRYDDLLPAFLRGDAGAANALIAGSLGVKKAVVEADEFELNLRKAMNYGHSMGHAFEAVSRNALPHGLAVVIGMLVENEFAIELAGFPAAEADRLARSARALVPPDLVAAIAALDLSTMADVLLKDKKAVGRTLKMACPSRIGEIRFVDLPLDGAIPGRVAAAIGAAQARFAAA